MGIASAVNNFAGSAGGSSIIDIASGYGAARMQQMANERMYKHRYQWMMQDMKKAGLNPVLAGQLGAGPAPSMSMPTINSSASQRALHRAQIGAANNLAAKHGEEAKLATQNILQSAAQTDYTNASAEAQRLQNERNRQDEKVYKDYPWLRPVRLIMENLGPAGAAAVGAATGFGLGRQRNSNVPRSKTSRNNKRNNKDNRWDGRDKYGSYKIKPDGSKWRTLDLPPYRGK